MKNYKFIVILAIILATACNSFFFCKGKNSEYHQFLNGETITITLPDDFSKSHEQISYNFKKPKGSQKFLLFINRDGEFTIDGIFDVYRKNRTQIVLGNRWGTFTFYFNHLGSLSHVEQHINANTQFKIKEQKVSFNL